jgi:hypothetical protein
VCCVDEKNLLPLPGISFIPWLSGPQPSHYVKFLSKEYILVLIKFLHLFSAKRECILLFAIKCHLQGV